MYKTKSGRIIIRNNDGFDYKEVLKRYKENPEQCRTGIFYITPDGSKIETLCEGEHTVLGLIVESPIKAQIGLMNIFLYSELKQTEN